MVLLFFFLTEENIQVAYVGSGKYKMTVGSSVFEVSGSMLQDNNVCHLNCIIDGNVSRSRIVIQGRDVNIFTPVSAKRL